MLTFKVIKKILKGMSMTVTLENMRALFKKIGVFSVFAWVIWYTNTKSFILLKF